MPSDRQRRGSSLMGLVAAALGLALFAWFVQRIGAAVIWEGLAAVGWGLAAIVAIAGLRFAARATAWSICLEPPHGMPFRAAFAAVLAGDALGNLTPLGLIASEPAKAAFVRGHVPLGPVITALAIENILYTLSALAMIGASTIGLLVGFDLPLPVEVASAIAVFAVAVVFIVVAWLIWRRPALVSRVLSVFVRKTSTLQERVDQLRRLEEQIYTFAVRRPGALVRAVAVEATFHALGIVEVYITLWLMLDTPPTLLISFVLEGALRFIVVVFKFVPLQLGVGEWTAGSFAHLLGYDAAVGGTLSIVRKVRTIFWVLIGTLLMIGQGFRGRS